MISDKEELGTCDGCEKTGATLKTYCTCGQPKNPKPTDHVVTGQYHPECWLEHLRNCR